MLSRRHTDIVVFRFPFRIKGIDRAFPAGTYTMNTDEKLIEGLLFAAYHRVSTTMLVAAEGSASRLEMIDVDPQDVFNAQALDAAAGANSPE
jgi:hypothetical protein